jgi:putative oxidoreductase
MESRQDAPVRRPSVNVNRAVQVTYFLLRVVSGLLFMQAGGMKLLGWFGGMPGGGGTPPLMSQVGIGGVLELVGGLLIMLGLFTRPVAFILSGEMAVAYWQFHAPNGAWPIQNHGEPAVLLCFIFLFIAARGGGLWSLDALLWGRRGGAAMP